VKISVIIPTFNGAGLLEKSLETWTRQSVSASEFEVIIVDNNSTDQTHDIIQNLVNQNTNFRYLREMQPGASHARHAGAAGAKAEILLFADDDGLFNNVCLGEILKVYETFPAVAAVAGKIELLWDSAPPEWIGPYEFMLGKLDYGEKIITGYDLYLNGGLFSIRKNVFNELKGFNPDLVGEYLTGDGDTGLVRKLHNNRYLIGWTPFACMQHLLEAEKHGTVNDMGRRFYNTGISETYALFRANDFRLNGRVLGNLLRSKIFYLKKALEYFVSGMKNYKVRFSLMQRKGELSFYLRWLLSSSFRKSCKTDNWI
jgi:glycosyltransferase involved in cell wall biosynthesis